MAIPILKQGDVLIVSVQAASTDQDLVQLRDDLAARVGQLRSHGVVIDVSALDVMDSFATRTLRGRRPSCTYLRKVASERATP